MAPAVRTLCLTLLIGTAAFFLGSAWRDGRLARLFQRSEEVSEAGREAQAKQWIRDHPEQFPQLAEASAKKIRKNVARSGGLRLNEAERLSMERFQTTSAPAPAAPTQPDAADDVADASPRISPEGTYYMLEYVPVRTDRGVVGFEPGQRVKLLEARPDKGMLLVSDGQYQTEVFASQMTNDLDLAAAVRRQDVMGQQRIAAYQAEQQQAYEAANLTVNKEHSKNVAAINARVAKSSAVGTLNSPLNEDARPASSLDRTLLSYGIYPYRYYRSSYYRSPYYYSYGNYYPYNNSASGYSPHAYSY